MSDLQDHPDYRQLVNAVRAAPDDDLPRLVLADWLEEHDAPDWAEFIRVHCEAARFPHAARIWSDTFTDAEAVIPDWQRALTCARLVRELWPAVAEVMFADVANEHDFVQFEPDGQCVFGDEVITPELLYAVRRGFVEGVIHPLLYRWIDGSRSFSGPLLVSRQPVRWVRFTDHVHSDFRITSWSGVPGDNTTSTSRRRLPWCIASRLTKFVRRTEEATADPPHHVWHYADWERAAEALSAAAIAWALEEAGRG